MANFLASQNKEDQENRRLRRRSTVKMNTVLRNAFVALGGLLLFMPMAAQAASVTSTTASIPLTYNGAESLSLSTSISSGTSVAFPAVGGMANSWVTINTQYTLAPGRVLTIEAGFSSGNAMFNGTGQSIAISNITANFSSGGTANNISACGITPGTGNTAILQTYSCGWIVYPAVTASNTSGTHTDGLALTLNPSLVAAPGAYTGNLLISAQAN
jgi:hypothetical protein